MLTKRPVKLRTLAMGLALTLAATNSAHPGNSDGDDYVESIESWRRERVARLTSKDGWLTLAGLHWLNQGENRFGSDPSNDLAFPEKAPPRVGRFLLDGGRVRVEIEPGVVALRDGQPVRQLDLKSDAEGVPTVLTLGDLSFYVIERGERRAVRLKDRNHPARQTFRGIESFPVDRQWRLTGRFETYDPPRKIPIPTVLGTVSELPSWGSVAFEFGGHKHRLDAVAEPGDEQLFIIFADQTTAVETYGGGRYLYADAPSPEGTVVLDFNKAYNPPCVFTLFATCPLPPHQNRLAVRVEAGEKNYAKGH